MGELAWDAVRDEFAFDGSWHDIYVLGTKLTDWQVMFDRLRFEGYDLTYFRDGRPSTLPTSAADAFPLPGMCDRLLSVRFAGVLANCHFFTDEEIEFDIDPREVEGQEQFDALIVFMRCLADATGGDAILTPENTAQYVILRVPPHGAPVEHVAH